MEISVIIPVYQAEHFVAAAVRSALSAPETAEVILVEDGSRDRSLEICSALAQDPRVKLVTHPGNTNRGISTSRNLGIAQATCPFIAFLDADDTYLPGRFDMVREIIALHPDADGVHEMIGVHYFNEDFRKQHLQRAGGEDTGLRIAVPPQKLFRALASGDHGHIHLNGLVIRRTATEHEQMFDETLVLSEDSDFILRMAATRRLYGGDLTRIVALRGVHGQNTVFTNPNALKYRRQYLQKCIDNDFYGSRDIIACLHIIKRYIGVSTWYAPFLRFGILALPVKFVLITGFIVFHPRVLLSLIKRLCFNALSG